MAPAGFPYPKTGLGFRLNTTTSAQSCADMRPEPALAAQLGRELTTADLRTDFNRESGCHTHSWTSRLAHGRDLLQAAAGFRAA